MKMLSNNAITKDEVVAINQENSKKITQLRAWCAVNSVIIAVLVAISIL